jgi:hypothetical protein
MIPHSLHLYLLIGQSNMAGRGVVGQEDTTPHPRVYSLDRAGLWVPAVDPIHYDKRIAGVGPGLSFGKAMAARDPEIRIGLMPCAAGGSPIRVWQSGGYWEQTASWPYDDAVRRTRTGMQQGVLKGILWHQGESDSNEQDAPLYANRLSALIAALRADLDAVDVPFVVATLGDFFAARNPWARMINDALRQLPFQIHACGCVTSEGLAHKGDDLHFGTAAARELGRRYAEAMTRLRDVTAD